MKAWSKDSFPSRKEGIREKRLFRHIEMSVPSGEEGPESEEEISQAKAEETPASQEGPLQLIEESDPIPPRPKTP